MSRVEEKQTTEPEQALEDYETESSYLEPTQNLADIKGLALFPE